MNRIKTVDANYENDMRDIDDDVEKFGLTEPDHKRGRGGSTPRDWSLKARSTEKP